MRWGAVGAGTLGWMSGVVEADLAGHFGFVRRWMLVGPFDNTGGAGFGRVYPPE